MLDSALNLNREQAMADEQKKGKGKVVIAVIAVLVLLIVGLVAVFFYVTSEPKAQEAQSEQTAATSESNAKYLRIGPIFQLDQFIVNLLSQGGRRYLKVSISLEMTTPNLENELNAKRAPVRDIIIDVLTSKSIDDISTTRGKDKLKEEIIQRLNEILVDGKIRNIFLTDMAIQ